MAFVLFVRNARKTLHVVGIATRSAWARAAFGDGWAVFVAGWCEGSLFTVVDDARDRRVDG